MRLGLATVGRAKFYFIARCSKLNLVLYCGIPASVLSRTLDCSDIVPPLLQLKLLDLRSNQILVQHKTDWILHEHMKQFSSLNYHAPFCFQSFLDTIFQNCRQTLKH